MDPEENGGFVSKVITDDVDKYRLTRIEGKIDAILRSQHNTEERLTWVVNTVTALTEIIKQIPMVKGMFGGNRG